MHTRIYDNHAVCEDSIRLAPSCF